MTYEDMCETILKANILQKENGDPYTTEEIFDLAKISGFGNLTLIGWYEEAKKKLNKEK